MKTFRLLPVLILSVLAEFVAPAQNLPDAALKSVRFKLLPQESIDFFLRRVLLPAENKDFSFDEIGKYSSSPFRHFQLRYRNAALHQFPVLVFRQNENKSSILFYPAIPLSGFPTDADLRDYILMYTGNRWEKFRMKEITSLSPPRAERILEDENGLERFREDWLLRFADSSVKARVFRPDPVSRLQMAYGGNLRDYNDSSYALLRQAMDSVRIRISFENDSFRLKNAYMNFGEFSPPLRKKALSASADSFLFDRNQPQFEEINAFYHLTSFRQYINGLGFDSLALYPVSVDAHGMDGADQSAFSPLQGFIAYGDGNVDDAEDASVIIHEYVHVLCHAAFPFGNSGQERRALEEGICDYLAGSYIRSMSNFLPERIFRWDGNNEFWSGRSLVSSAVYPVDLSGNLYADGGIFCSALHRLEESIGRNQLHRILLSALPALAPNIGMNAAARFLLLTDSAISGGQHSSLIRQHFLERGINPEMVVVSAKVPENSGNQLYYDEFLRPFFWSQTGIEFADLYDASGVFRRRISIQPGIRMPLPLENLQPGLYFLKAGLEVFRIPVQAPR